ncbi:MAG: type I restriction enzyme HsdR N-terminal domain-containing protein [Muribaculaceae bacterium]|nr:type I restriction enzyme HsdR N-terminal domain-containing protein [Alistipes senegalensis]MCM1473645.1 type I restriction enzyme HsdR N-terminal domain-containing protein [Muribaculaceae bacterium]
MGITFNKNRCRQPKIYSRKKKKYFYDPIRNKLVHVTPEEIIRQKVVKILQENNIPDDMIEVEKCLSNYGIDSKKRADIIINYSSGNYVYPLAIIECKAADVKLCGDYQKQAFVYADCIGADYVVVTNGKENFYFHYNQDINKYESIIDLPYYKDMISGKCITKVPERIPFNELETKGFVYIGNNIGKSTSFNLQIAMINLLECLLDTKYTLSVQQYQYFRIIKDMGISVRSYDDIINSDRVFKNLYRSFLIDSDGIEKTVSIGISNYYTKLKHDIHKTIINIAIDNENISYHALQLVVDDNLYMINNTVKFCHINNITIKKDNEEKLKLFIKNYCPNILKNNRRIYLGELKNNRLWNLSAPNVVELIENLISYALVRDKYREYCNLKKI